MPDHSPLPWTPRRSEVFGSNDIRDVFDAGRREVRVMGFGLTGGTQAAANAELIVRAVNAHAPMLEALKMALPYIREAANGFGDPDREVAAYEAMVAAINTAEDR